MVWRLAEDDTLVGRGRGRSAGRKGRKLGIDLGGGQLAIPDGELVHGAVAGTAKSSVDGFPIADIKAGRAACHRIQRITGRTAEQGSPGTTDIPDCLVGSA